MSISILCTGASGFVGSNLKKYLEGDFYFRALSRNVLKNGYNFSSCKIEGYKGVVHLAGNHHSTSIGLSYEKYKISNTTLTKQLFDQFLQSDCEVFVYMSSVKACADEVEGILTEETMPKPVTAYGLSKLKAEEYILSQQLPKGKRVYILRPCMIHGPGNKGNLNLLYNFVSKGIPYPFGKFQNQRSFVSVENVCFVIKTLIGNSTIPNGVYNIADNLPLSTNDLVSLISNTLNKPQRILNLPVTLVKILAKLGNVLPLPLNSERLQKLTENYVVSNQKIKQAMGKELPLSTEEGIIKTIKSFVK